MQKARMGVSKGTKRGPKVIVVDFLDSLMCRSEPQGLVETTVIGFLKEITKSRIYLTPYICKGSVDDHNGEVILIRRRRVLRMRYL